MKTISLNGKWNLKGKRQIKENDISININATVPGCVQLDLCDAGYLPKDIFMGLNIRETEKFEDYEWWYEKSFLCPEIKENVYLVFEAVDCLAEYFLNGQKIGESDNAFIAHEFKIDDYLIDGENNLVVHLKSPIISSFEKDYTVKLFPNPVHTEARHIRKPIHSYGWDIMPRAVTSGLWRDVKIELRDDIYFSQTYFNNGEAFYYVLNAKDCDLDGVEVEIEASCGNDSYTKQRVRATNCANLIYLGIKNKKLWWPFGYGEPNVYDGFARIFKDGKLVHEEKISFGIKTVKIDREDRLNGKKGKFRILVNDVEIMCKGSNWVPLDAFHSRDAERYEKALSLVSDIGCNILRCWGGNVYEDHVFFDYCDRHGIMVWQDFSMACVRYPEDEDFKRKLSKEATAVIRKLRNHPSIILWAGDNECDSCNCNTNPDHNSLTREVLPKVVELNDPNRPFLPSSPYISGAEYEAGIRAQVIGSPLVEDHLWGPRDYFKSDFYKTNRACFVSETGYHGCPSLESIKKFITPLKVWPYVNNDEWILHSSNQKGKDHRVMLMQKQIERLFGDVPTTPEEYVLASQISQAEAKKYFIERIRVGRPEKTGVIWWNLLDSWPQMSDAVVDYYFTKKLAYSYIKLSQAPFVICADEIKSQNLDLYACNDTLVEKHGSFLVKDAMTDEIIFNGDFIAKANMSILIKTLPASCCENRILIFEWEVNGEKGFNHYLCGFPPISFEKYCDFLQKYNLK